MTVYLTLTETICLSCTVFELQRVICRKSPILSHLPAFGATLKATSCKFRQGFWHQKTRVRRLSCGVVFVIVCSAVLTQYWRVTDRHMTTANTALAQRRAVKRSLSCCKRSRVIRSMTPIALYTKADYNCNRDRQAYTIATVVGRLLTARAMDRGEIFLSPELGTKFQREVPLFLRQVPNFLKTKCRINRRKHACQKPAQSVQSFQYNTGL